MGFPFLSLWAGRAGCGPCQTLCQVWAIIPVSIPTGPDRTGAKENFRFPLDKRSDSCYNPSCRCECSSSGRAPPCQGGGSEFEPRHSLQNKNGLRKQSVFILEWGIGVELAASTSSTRCAALTFNPGGAGSPQKRSFCGARERASRSGSSRFFCRSPANCLFYFRPCPDGPEAIHSLNSSQNKASNEGTMPPTPPERPLPAVVFCVFLPDKRGKRRPAARTPIKPEKLLPTPSKSGKIVGRMGGFRNAPSASHKVKEVRKQCL